MVDQKKYRNQEKSSPFNKTGLCGRVYELTTTSRLHG